MPGVGVAEGNAFGYPYYPYPRDGFGCPRPIDSRGIIDRTGPGIQYSYKGSEHLRLSHSHLFKDSFSEHLLIYWAYLSSFSIT